MCAVDFIVESEVVVESTCSVASVFVNVDFSTLEFGADDLAELLLLEDNAALFNGCFDIQAVIAAENFYSITTLLNLIKVFEVSGVPVNEAAFMTQIDTLVTAEFWTETKETLIIETYITQVIETTYFTQIFALYSINLDGVINQFEALSYRADLLVTYTILSGLKTDDELAVLNVTQIKMIMAVFEGYTSIAEYKTQSTMLVSLHSTLVTVIGILMIP